jgi:hypothetical protein
LIVPPCQRSSLRPTLLPAPLVHKVLFENASEFDNQLSALIERTRGRGLTVSGGEDASFPLQWVPVAPEPTAASNLCRMFCEYYGLRFARVFEKSLPHARGRGRYFVEALHKLLDLLSRYALGAEGENKKLHTAFNAAVRDINEQRDAAANEAEAAACDAAAAIIMANRHAIDKSRSRRVLIGDTGGSITVAGGAADLARPPAVCAVGALPLSTLTATVSGLTPCRRAGSRPAHSFTNGALSRMQALRARTRDHPQIVEPENRELWLLFLTG